MDHHSYYAAGQRTVEACVVGSGGFGRSFLFQGMRVPGMRARVAVDVDAAVAAAAFASVGLPADRIAVCGSAGQAARAWAEGRYIAAADLAFVVDLPVDVVVEATGNPEAGARHAQLAIDAGHHVVLVSKEVDSVVGPVLAHRARRRGRVVTPVDGDQPSLLIGLVTWAQTLGFDVVSAGKASEYDFVYDPSTDTMTSNGVSIAVPGFAGHWTLGSGAPATIAAARALACAALPQRAVPDLCELLVVANATGFLPDRADLHAPIARIPEVPSFFGLADEGGLLARSSTLDVFHCLRRPDEASFAGGVYVIVRCEDRETWDLLAAKGHVLSRDGRRAMIYLPRHLLGLEAATSVLDAVVHGRSSGAQVPRPRLDLIARAQRDLPAGTLLTMGGHHHVIDGATAELLPARALGPDAPAPYYLAANRPLVRPVAAGAAIACGDVALDPGSTLLALRREQDAIFFGETAGPAPPVATG